MKFVQAEPEAIETYCELGNGWAKFAKFRNFEEEFSFLRPKS